MTKLLVIFVAIFVVLTLTCSATLYTVGDASGWDISTDLDTWVKDKKFVVGDSLVFQYSSYHSVSEVTKENYEGCNATKVLQSGSNGNTSYVLSKPGDRYFVCGNKLHCYGGMKLHVHVEENPSASSFSPASAPQPLQGGSLPRSSKNNIPSNVVPGSASFIHVGFSSLLVVWFGILVNVF